MWRQILISAWVILQCASPATPFLPFIFLQKHLWVLAVANGEASEPCAEATLLSRHLKPTAGAGCLLALEPGRRDSSNSGWGQAAALPQQMVSIWFSQSCHWRTPILVYAVTYFSLNRRKDGKHNAISK